ncbi:hypothetical protein C9374_004711 [Naegleria lovaniensis]|uniref:Uncharacterized protein n=1 Tax=Naegleria lovaniensis TaxID=51637 RepID=A0AA88KIZ0_NAELO|nr:uncharacterized protein C9374_004711 [Naegleria lovaniensis]KAG2383374.1 hypothetical protein C9374_004711 [Naegleria lovaniensis]
MGNNSSSVGPTLSPTPSKKSLLNCSSQPSGLVSKKSSFSSQSVSSNGEIKSSSGKTNDNKSQKSNTSLATTRSNEQANKSYKQTTSRFTDRIARLSASKSKAIMNDERNSFEFSDTTSEDSEEHDELTMIHRNNITQSHDDFSKDFKMASLRETIGFLKKKPKKPRNNLLISTASIPSLDNPLSSSTSSLSSETTLRKSRLPPQAPNSPKHSNTIHPISFNDSLIDVVEDDFDQSWLDQPKSALFLRPATGSSRTGQVPTSSTLSISSPTSKTSLLNTTTSNTAAELTSEDISSLSDSISSSLPSLQSSLLSSTGPTSPSSNFTNNSSTLSKYSTFAQQEETLRVKEKKEVLSQKLSRSKITQVFKSKRLIPSTDPNNDFVLSGSLELGKMFSKAKSNISFINNLTQSLDSFSLKTKLTDAFKEFTGSSPSKDLVTNDGLSFSDYFPADDSVLIPSVADKGPTSSSMNDRLSSVNIDRLIDVVQPSSKPTPTVPKAQPNAILNTAVPTSQNKTHPRVTKSSTSTNKGYYMDFCGITSNVMEIIKDCEEWSDSSHIKSPFQIEISEPINKAETFHLPPRQDDFENRFLTIPDLKTLKTNHHSLTKEENLFDKRVVMSSP